MSRKPNEQLARTILDGPQGQLIRTLVLQEQSPVSDAELAELIKQLKDYGDTLQKIGERNVSSHYQDVARAGQQRLDWAAMVKKAADILAAQDATILGVRGRAAVLQGQLDGANEKIEQMNAIDREAAEHVESVICMRSAHFTGEDPYVGWKGLGLALTQDYDDLAIKEAQLTAARALLDDVLRKHSDVNKQLEHVLSDYVHWLDARMQRAGRSSTTPDQRIEAAKRKIVDTSHLPGHTNLVHVELKKVVPTSDKEASALTDREIQIDYTLHCQLWDARSADDDGYSGSPGEWIVERLDELKTAAKERGITLVEPPHVVSALDKNDEVD